MPPKNIVLMYISDISGHRSAAIAIEKAIRLLSPKTNILSINSFNYTNPVSEKIVNHLYMGIITRAPKIWNYLYDNPRIIKRINKMRESVNRVNAPKIKKLFDEFRPDAVLCTQAFPCGLVANFKKTYGSNIKLVACLTDYVPHSYWLYDEVDYYITPSEEVTERLISKGIPPDKIRTFGIPFEPAFNENINKEEVFRKLNFKSGVSTVLIMGGGQGLGPINTVVRSLETVKCDLQEIVVAGINKKLYNALNRKIRNYKKKIVLFGYTDTIRELMGISDIIITKPGGITTAEALAKHLPMIIVKPIPGQEINNTLYLTQKQAALKVDNPEKVSPVIEELLNNPDKLMAMQMAAKQMSKPNASMDIAGLLLNL